MTYGSPHLELGASGTTGYAAPPADCRRWGSAAATWWPSSTRTTPPASRSAWPPARSAPRTRSSTGGWPARRSTTRSTTAARRCWSSGTELMPLVEKIRDRLPAVEKVIEVTPGRRRGGRVRSVAGRLLTGLAARRRRPRRHLPGDVLLRHHRPPQGRDAHPHQHGRAHRQRPRRLGVRARRQEHGGDAALPRRRLVVRPLRDPRRHPQHHDPGAGRGVAGRRDPRRGQPHLPGAGGAGPGAPGRAGRGQAVRGAQDLHVRRVPDAAAAAARGDGGVAGDRLHPGLRADRGRRRRHPPAARGAPGRRAPRAAGLGRAAAPGHGAADRRPGHARGPAGRRARRDLAAHPAADEGLPRQARGDREGRHRGRLVPHRRHGQGRRARATCSSRTGSRT